MYRDGYSGVFQKEGKVKIMAAHRHIDKICGAVMALVLVLTAVFANARKLGVMAVTNRMGYEQRLFDTSRVHTIDIVMDDWDGFLETCENEEYELCSLVIDQEAFQNAGIRAKGNTSLSMVSAYGNDRYSFKIEFDHYDSARTYYGLDKLSLNNIIQDNTYMKDYLSYQMMGYFGASAPLCSYVYITVNGEEWGLYLAVEGVEESFLERNYGSDYGNVYKPDNMDMGGGRGNGGGFDMEKFQKKREESGREASGGDDAEESGSAADREGAGREGAEENREGEADRGEAADREAADRGEAGIEPPGMELPEGEEDAENMKVPEELEFPAEGMGPPGTVLPEGEEDAGNIKGSGEMELPEGMQPPDFPGNGENRPEGGRGFGGPGRGMASEDVSLIYTDDEFDSYSNIFDNAKTDITDADKKRLIASLKSLNAGEAIESIVNVDEVMRYFTVHNFVCNFDSYTGSMIHNYYLYEKDGQMSMIPWDYNLAFGGFESQSDAEGLINYPIDTPVSGGDIESRPMLAWIFGSEDYTELYHKYFSEFISGYFESGCFAEMIDTVTQMIAPYVEKDPTKFCTYEEFETGADTLKTFCLLRAESIRGQLDGTIPSTEEGQKQDSSALVDGSAVTVSDMGSMGKGMMGRKEMH